MTGIWSKAEQAALSAQVLLRSGDADGAVNRAYHAMFDAARAALFAVDPGLVEAKTHATIIRRFGQHVVSPGWVDRELGRQLNETEELRLTADYESDPIDIANVQAVVDGMETFVAAVRTFLSSKSP